MLVFIQKNRRVQWIFALLLIESVLLDWNGKVFFPIVSFPKFKGDEFKQEEKEHHTNHSKNAMLLKELYPNDKRYYLFIQRDMVDPIKAQKIHQLLVKYRKK
jgi:hypothetical protein